MARGSPPPTATTPAVPPSPSRRDGIVRGLVAFAIGVVLLCGAYAILPLPGDAVDRLVQEDGPIEWAGALGVVAGAGLLLASFAIVRRDPARYGVSKVGTWFILLFALALLAFAGEEISWGQRVLGIATPESFSEANAQHETTIHNLNAFQGTSIDGDRLFRIEWVAFFVLLPIAALLSPWVRRTRARLLPVTVPLWLAALFVAAWVLGWAATHTLQGGFDSTYALGSAATEIQEAAVEILMGVAGLLTFLHFRRLRPAPPAQPPPAAASPPLPG